MHCSPFTENSTDEIKGAASDLREEALGSPRAGTSSGTFVPTMDPLNQAMLAAWEEEDDEDEDFLDDDDDVDLGDDDDEDFFDDDDDEEVEEGEEDVLEDGKAQHAEL